MAKDDDRTRNPFLEPGNRAAADDKDDDGKGDDNAEKARKALRAIIDDPDADEDERRRAKDALRELGETAAKAIAREVNAQGFGHPIHNLPGDHDGEQRRALDGMLRERT